MLIALHIMWSAIIWLLVLTGSTIAQYEQQTHMKSRTVQKGALFLLYTYIACFINKSGQVD